MTEKMGVTELKDLLKLILDGVSVGVEAAKDGKVGLTDLGLLMKLIPDVGPAFSGIGAIPGELADMSSEEAADLVAFVMTAVAVQDAHARELIEKSLKVAGAVFELVKAIKAPAMVA